MHGKIMLLGTSHPIQCGCVDDQSTEKFRAYVQERCRSYDICLVAEEMSCRGLSKHKVAVSIAQTVAMELNIAYLAADLEIHELKQLGIDEHSLGMAAIPPGEEQSDRAVLNMLREKIYDPLRECCWFARILAKDVWPTLFICGANHIENLFSLMQSVGQDVVLVHRDYEP